MSYDDPNLPWFPTEIVESIIFELWSSSLTSAERIQFTTTSRLVNKMWAYLFRRWELKHVHFPTIMHFNRYFTRVDIQGDEPSNPRFHCHSFTFEISPVEDVPYQGVAYTSHTKRGLAARLKQKNFPNLNRIVIECCNIYGDDRILECIPSHVEELAVTYKFNRKVDPAMAYLFQTMKNPCPHGEIALPSVRRLEVLGANPGILMNFFDFCPNLESFQMDDHMVQEIRRRLGSGDPRQSIVSAISTSIPLPFQQGMEGEVKKRQRLVLGDIVNFDRCPPPSQAAQNKAYRRNEKFYRRCLRDTFGKKLHALWCPSYVEIGAVGYCSPLDGTFVTLFNCHDLSSSGSRVIQDMSSIYGFGTPRVRASRSNRCNPALRAFQGIAASFSRKPKSERITRQYTVPLYAGTPAAHLFTEKIKRKWFEDQFAARRWFQASIDTITKVYGAKLALKREDFMLVTGTVDAQDYALFVSHNHPNGEVNFNVHSMSKVGEPWGQYATQVPVGSAARTPVCSSKVSVCGGPWKTVLIQGYRIPAGSSVPICK